MSVEITGMDEVLAKLEAKLSSSKLSRAENAALKVAGEHAKEKLKSAVSSYKDTGATVNEIVVGKPSSKGGIRTIDIGWDGKGADQRYRLVHLNEFGYTRYGRTYKPRGIGVVQKSYDGMKQELKEIEKNELRKLVD